MLSDLSGGENAREVQLLTEIINALFLKTSSLLIIMSIEKTGHESLLIIEILTRYKCLQNADPKAINIEDCPLWLSGLVPIYVFT